MSAALSNAPQSSRGAFAGLVLLLAGLGRAMKSPFDAILAGMVERRPVRRDARARSSTSPTTCLDDHIVRLGLRSPSERPAAPPRRERLVRGGRAERPGLAHRGRPSGGDRREPEQATIGQCGTHQAAPHGPGEPAAQGAVPARSGFLRGLLGVARRIPSTSPRAPRRRANAGGQPRRRRFAAPRCRPPPTSFRHSRSSL